MKSNPAVKINGVWKKYSLGYIEPYETITDKISNAMKKPFRKKNSNSMNQTFWALKNISFEVNHGEVLGIIGRNGAGKSTLLKILSRITSPTKGSIIINGKVGSLLEVGTGFHPELSGRENIYLSGSILGMKKTEIDSKFEDIIKFSEIEKFLDTPVKRYSSGMYVRLAFAVAAHLSPDILIVDEVLAVGDAQFQKKCLGMMGQVANEGRTVLFVSHNLTAIRSLCTRAILLRDGQIIEDEVANFVVNKYIGEIKDSVFEREWIDDSCAPQNSSAIVKKIWITKNASTPVEELLSDEEFYINILFKIKKENSSIGLTIVLFDTENNCVFSSVGNREPNWYGKEMPMGFYVSKCKIPANFLNNKWYLLSVLIFSKNFSDHYTINEALKFEIQDGASIRGDYYGDFSGLTRPDFKWVTNMC